MRIHIIFTILIIFIFQGCTTIPLTPQEKDNIFIKKIKNNPKYYLNKNNPTEREKISFID